MRQTLSDRSRSGLVVCICLAAFMAAICTSVLAADPEVDSARRFVEDAEADLKRLGERADRAEFLNGTDETPEHAHLAAEAISEYRARAAALAKEASKYNSARLPPDLDRKLSKLALGTVIPAPADPDKAEDLSKAISKIKENWTTAQNCTNQSQCRTKDDLYKIMRESRDPAELLAAWQEWHSPARNIRSLYAQMIADVNQGARELGFEDIGALWRSHYDMPSKEFAEEYDRLWSQVKPLYDALHCHVRAKLHDLYPDIVPATLPIPAHLLGNMWAQYWTGINDVVGFGGAKKQIDIADLLEAKNLTSRDMIRTAENFFVSMGFSHLPEPFWAHSMIAKPPDKKVNCHGSAWDIDAQESDVRLKMCVEATERDFLGVHHELGHIYYFLAYKDQPYLFRGGANPGFHEAIGDAVALSMTPSYLMDIGLLNEQPADSDDLPFLFHSALEKIPALAMAIVVDKWRWGVASGKIRPEDYNAAWWALREKYQGLSSPIPRTEDDFDAGMFYHISFNVPYDRYFIAYILQFDIHRALCEAADETGPLHQCSIYESKAAGERLKSALSMGASKPWPETLQKLTGKQRIDATSIIEYFAPVMAWLNEQNQARQCGW